MKETLGSYILRKTISNPRLCIEIGTRHKPPIKIRAVEIRVSMRAKEGDGIHHLSHFYPTIHAQFSNDIDSSLLSIVSKMVERLEEAETPPNLDYVTKSEGS